MEAYELLEEEWGKWAGVGNVVACNSGTAALHLAMEAARPPQGAEMIVPDFSMIAVARAVTLAGMVPAFADCGDDLLMTPESVGSLVTDRTFGVVVVHTYGRRADVAGIRGAMEAKGCCPYVVEDLAEAHGVAPHPDTEAACWSFYRNKIVCGEEGGAASFNRDVANLAALARRLRCHGFTEEHDFWHSPGGHNYRLANSLAAIIIDSLRSSRPRLEARRRAEAAYDRLCPDAWRMPPRDAPWVYDLRVPGMTRARQDRVVRSLNEAGVGARHGFKPLSQQPEYRPLRRGTGPVADRASGEVIYLPINPGGSPGLPATTDERVETAFDVLRAALG